MTTIAEALKTAIQHHQAGELPVAEQIYRQILAIEPEQADALHLLGCIALQVGQNDLAVEYIRRAIELQGNVAAFHSNLGLALQNLGKLDEAVAAYHRALNLKPAYVEAHNQLGHVLRDQGKLDEAGVAYRRALDIKPDYAEAHSNLGVVLMEQGKLEEAVASFRRALKLMPGLAETHNSLGNALKGQRKLNEAVAAYRRALDIKPDYAEAHSNYGHALRDQGKLDEAGAAYRRALDIKPDYAEAHSNLGVVLMEQGKLEEAVASFRRAIQLMPGLADAHNNLGVAFKDQGKPDEAAACFLQALERKPDFFEAFSNLGNVLGAQGNLDGALVSYRRAMDLKPENVPAHCNFVYTLSFHPGQDSRSIYEASLDWNRRHAEPLARHIRPHDNDRTPNRRLRVGYVSPDFRDHVIGRGILSLFREHDRRQFEVFAYSQVRRPDTWTTRMQADADVWRNIVRVSDEAVAQRVREDRIDILVDLTLHLADNRLLVFAHKPAPVQVTFAGYPGTTGLSAIDYRLTDPYLDPPDLQDHCYSEESFRLPETFWCYHSLSQEPAVSALPAAERGYVTFGCLNNFCKVNDPVLQVWARVLRGVDRSQLLLMAPEGTARRETLQRLAKEGVAAERVKFVFRQPHREYLELYQGIDISLDTFPYGGYTTSLDSFWMGAPVVTLVGQTVVGRAGLSQLMNLELPELIAHSLEEYVQIAVELAHDLPSLSRLRSTLRQRMELSPLMDPVRFTRGIEAAYRTMWRRWCGE